MKKFICSALIIFISAQITLNAQITTPKDSLEFYLCKSWEVDYAMLGGMKIGRMPGATEINYEFKKDKTYLLFDKDAVRTGKGTWEFDPKKKMIRLKDEKGISRQTIVSLKPDELIMLADTKEQTPDDPMDIKMVYKIRKQ